MVSQTATMKPELTTFVSRTRRTPHLHTWRSGLHLCLYLLHPSFSGIWRLFRPPLAYTLMSRGLHSGLEIDSSSMSPTPKTRRRDKRTRTGARSSWPPGSIGTSRKCIYACALRGSRATTTQYQRRKQLVSRVVDIRIRLEGSGSAV